MLKELNEPEKAAAKSAKPAKAGDDKSRLRARQSARSTLGRSSTADKTGKAPAAKSRQAIRTQISGRRQGVAQGSSDSTICWENWARPRTSRPPKIDPGIGLRAAGPQPPSRGEKAGADKLGGKDKDLDERLEELTGRKKKRPSSDQERTGPVGEMIKEMREVEERLGKPDPSEDTQKKQKQIVKRIETMIEQAKQSGSSAGSMVMRRVPQPGAAAGSSSTAIKPVPRPVAHRR